MTRGMDADESLDFLIAQRAEQLEEQRRTEASWAASARQFNLAAAAERKRAWARYHLDLQRIHTQLAAEHQQKAAALIDEGAARS